MWHKILSIKHFIKRRNTSTTEHWHVFADTPSSVIMSCCRLKQPKPKGGKLRKQTRRHIILKLDNSNWEGKMGLCLMRACSHRTSSEDLWESLRTSRWINVSQPCIRCPVYLRYVKSTDGVSLSHLSNFLYAWTFKWTYPLERKAHWP